MIKLKQGICSLCPPESRPTSLIKGMCHTHYWNGVNKRSIEKKKNQKPIDLINPVILKEKTELGLWFHYHITHNTWVCENCGDYIIHSFEKAMYSAQAHILPKGQPPKYKFESVKSHLDNHLTLCTVFDRNDCHTNFDSSWLRASKMPVIEIAQKKVLRLIPLLTEREIGMLPDVFKELL